MNVAIKILSLGKTYLHLVPTTLIHEQCRRAIWGSGSTYAWVCIFTDPLDCSLPGSSVYGISQARILEGVAISSFRGSSEPRDGASVSCGSRSGRWILYHWATWEALCLDRKLIYKKKNNFIQNMVPPSRDPKLKVGNRERQNTCGKWSLIDWKSNSQVTS